MVAPNPDNPDPRFPPGSNAMRELAVVQARKRTHDHGQPIYPAPYRAGIQKIRECIIKVAQDFYNQDLYTLTSFDTDHELDKKFIDLLKDTENVLDCAESFKGPEAT